MIDACRLSRAQVQVVPHNDVAAVDAALAARTQPRAVVLVETIYSVLGDAAPVRELAEVCAARGAVLIADEAHALGVAGAGGRGLLHEAGLGDRPDVVGTLTLSKSLGSQGGAVLSSPAVREHLVNRARPFIYDTGLAPAAAGGALAALRVVEDEPERVARVNEISAVLARACGVEQPAGAVLAVPMPGPLEAVAAVEKAAGNGVRIGCFRPPVHPRRDLAAPAHRPCPARRRRARPGGRGAGRAAVTVLFVTGTDTEVGKTVVTAALAAVQLSLGRTVAVVKPAQTGIGPDEDGDLAEVRRLAGRCGDLRRGPAARPARPGHRCARRRTRAARPRHATRPGRPGRLRARRDPGGGRRRCAGQPRRELEPDRPRRLRAVRRPPGRLRGGGPGRARHPQPRRPDRAGDPGACARGRRRGRRSWPAEPGLAEEQNLLDLPRVTGVPLLGQVPEGAGALPVRAFRRGALDWVPDI